MKAISASIAYDGRRSVRGKRIGPAVSHLVVVTRDGRIFERFSDMPAGEWGEVPAPAKRAAGARVGTGKK